jgi:hypothetical protein
MMEWLTLKWSATLLWLKPPLCMPTAWLIFAAPYQTNRKHSIIVRLMQRFRQTGNVTDRPRAGRPRKTTPREDRLISRRARQRPFSTAGAVRSNLQSTEKQPQTVTPHPQKQLCPKCDCPEMNCFVGAKPLHDRR